MWDSGLFRVCVPFCIILFCFTENVTKILTNNNWVMIPKNWSANNRVRYFYFPYQSQKS